MAPKKKRSSRPGRRSSRGRRSGDAGRRVAVHRPTHALFMNGQVYGRIEARGSSTTIKLLPSGAVSHSKSPSLRDELLLGNWRGPLKYMFSQEDLRDIPWGAKIVPWDYVTEFVPA